jgi:hypothetical protein
MQYGLLHRSAEPIPDPLKSRRRRRTVRPPRKALGCARTVLAGLEVPDEEQDVGSGVDSADADAV